jgi:hypothetical protein
MSEELNLKNICKMEGQMIYCVEKYGPNGYYWEESTEKPEEDEDVTDDEIDEMDEIEEDVDVSDEDEDWVLKINGVKVC